MNPEWVELAQDQRGAEIEAELSAAKAPRIAIPDKLWQVIDATKGWFLFRTGSG